MYGFVIHNKKDKRVFPVKAAWFLADLFGLTFTLIGVLKNLDNIGSAVLIMLSGVYLSLRIYYYRRQKEQAVRREELELWHMEQDKLERIDKNKVLRRWRDIEGDEYPATK